MIIDITSEENERPLYDKSVPLLETDNQVRNIVSCLMGNNIRRCIMVDELPSAAIPRYEAEKTVGLDANKQLFSFFEPDNFYPTF